VLPQAYKGRLANKKQNLDTDFETSKDIHALFALAIGRRFFPFHAQYVLKYTAAELRLQVAVV